MLKVILGVITAATVLFMPALVMIGVGLFVNPALMDAELCKASTLTVGDTIPNRLTATTSDPASFTVFVACQPTFPRCHILRLSGLNTALK